MSKFNIGIVGDVVVDLSLLSNRESKLRLGGIIHCARGLWALGVDYGLYYFCPSYLENELIEYSNHHGSVFSQKLGTVNGCPYLFLINEVKEIGNQGYDFPLREAIKIEYDEFNNSNEFPRDVMVISGNYELSKVAQVFTTSRVHVDLANNISDLNELSQLNFKFETIFISTSSDIFKKHFADSFEDFIKHFKGFCNRIILKENRGGSRGYDFLTDSIVFTESQTLPIIHSVGVGDVYNVAYLKNYRNYSFKKSMDFASWVASEYAQTTYPDDFKLGVERLKNESINDILNLKGVSLPWETRSDFNIYIAAPDFDFIDTKYIDVLEESLIYHNFKPRRPVKENGQMEENASKQRRRELYRKDMSLLEDCDILIAVILNNDPGTMIEIGLAKTLKMPLYVYDPYSIAQNCMLTEVPDLLSNDLDEILSEVFSVASKIKNHD